MTRARRSPALSRALLCAAVVATALPSTACHILGISQIPCDPDADDQCPDGMRCEDGVCITPQPVGEGEGEGETEVLGAVRDVDDNCAEPSVGPPTVSAQMQVRPDGAGVDALHSPQRPFGGDEPAIALDADACALRASSCGVPTTFDASTRAPVGVRAEYAVLEPAAGVGGDMPSVEVTTDGQPFAFELIARMPSSAGTVLRFDTDNDDQDGDAPALAIATATIPEGSQAELSLDGGGGVLAFDVAGRWMHLFCHVDPARALVAAGDGVLCAVDGGPPSTGAFGDSAGLSSSALHVALPLTGDSAVASFLVWTHVEPLDSDVSVALDLVFERARARLLAYNGVDTVSDRAFVARPFSTTRVLTLPRDPELEVAAQQESLALVGGRWPRTALLEDEQEAGLLLEPSRVDLSFGALRECTGDASDAFVGLEPAGAIHDACTALDNSYEVEALEDGPLVISAFVQRARDSSVLTVEVGGAIGEACTVTFPLTGPLADPACTLNLSVERGPDPALERVVLITNGAAQGASKTSVRLTFTDPGAFLSRPAIWGAQVEQGRAASSVITPGVNPDGARQADGFFVHGATYNLASVSWRIEVQTPPLDGDYQPIYLMRDQLFSQSYFIGQLSFSGGQLTSSALVGTFPPGPGDPIAEVGYFADAPSAVGARALSIASTTAGEDCGALASCNAVQIGALPDGLAVSHVTLSGSQETLLVRSVAATALGDGSLPLALSTRFEPRINGCTIGGVVLAQLDRCPADADDPQCGDSDNLADLDVAETENAPLVGREARVLDGSASVELSLQESSAYLLEARFRVPDSDGPIVALEGDDGVPVLALDAEDGAVRITVRNAVATVPTVEDEWVQLLCALSAEGVEVAVTCYRNLQDAPVFDRLTTYEMPAGALTIGAGVAFDRVRLQEMPGLAPYGALLAALRQPQSFGLHTSARRAFTRFSERRTGLAHAQASGELFLVGDGWPRTAVASRKPALLVEPALTDPLDDDFSDFAPSGGASASDERGPGPRSQVSSASDVTLTAPGAGAPGCASVYVKRVSDDARIDIDVGDAAVRHEDGDGWRRLSVCSLPTRTVTAVRIVVRGDALLAHPQLDALAVTAPVVDGVRARGALRVDSTDLTLGGFGGDLSFDASTRGEGVIAQLFLPTEPSYSFRALREFDNDNDEHFLVELLEKEAGEPPGLVVAADIALDPNGTMALTVRETALWLRSPTGSIVGNFAVMPPFPAVELTIGAGVVGDEDSAAVRLHEVVARPILP